MTRLHSVLATVFLLAILQLCAALESAHGFFKIMMKDRAIGAQGPHIILGDPRLFAAWELEGPSDRLRIRLAGDEVYLGYDGLYPNAPLLLTRQPVEWKLVTQDDGLEIQAVGSDLVAGKLGDSPVVGLTKQDKEGRQVWRFESLEDLHATSVLPDGDYYFEHSGGFLTPSHGGPDARILLIPEDKPQSVWTVHSSDGETFSIQNKIFKTFLAYHPNEPRSLLFTSSEPYYFMLDDMEYGEKQILTANPIGGKQLAVAQLPVRAYPPLVGLWEPVKSDLEVWTIRPADGLSMSDRSSGQYRLPCRKLGCCSRIGK
ncbi:hypothetical protein BGZ73_005644 [Actinomortierella ambigua]|nr:hypothetical protein BGZ73_005644 [Actinomortierella ambigua]